MSKTAFVYMLASKKNGTLYTGVTSNLERRMYEHKHHLLDGFTDKYDVTRLVWFTQGEDIREAITLEKKIKNRNRQWKITLIEKTNPNWDDLAPSWMDSATPLRYAQNDESAPAPSSSAPAPSSSAPLPSSCTPLPSSCAQSQDPQKQPARKTNE
jgi:putative endonuclease